MINEIPEKFTQVGETIASHLPEHLKSAAAIQERIRQRVLAAARLSQLDRFVDHISPPPQMLLPSYSGVLPGGVRIERGSVAAVREGL